MQNNPHKHAHKILRYMNRVRCKQIHVQRCVTSGWRVIIDLHCEKSPLSGEGEHLNTAQYATQIVFFFIHAQSQ